MEFQNQIRTKPMITIVPMPNSNMGPPRRVLNFAQQRIKRKFSSWGYRLASRKTEKNRPDEVQAETLRTRSFTETSRDVTGGDKARMPVHWLGLVRHITLGLRSLGPGLADLLALVALRRPARVRRGCGSFLLRRSQIGRAHVLNSSHLGISY